MGTVQASHSTVSIEFCVISPLSSSAPFFSTSSTHSHKVHVISTLSYSFIIHIAEDSISSFSLCTFFHRFLRLLSPDALVISASRRHRLSPRSSLSRLSPFYRFAVQRPERNTLIEPPPGRLPSACPPTAFLSASDASSVQRLTNTNCKTSSSFLFSLCPFSSLFF